MEKQQDRGQKKTVASLTTSEESKEEGDKKFTRKEYNYSSFSRAFTVPDVVTAG